jgi:hypothetical protein
VASRDIHPGYSAGSRLPASDLIKHIADIPRCWSTSLLSLEKRRRTRYANKGMSQITIPFNVPFKQTAAVQEISASAQPLIPPLSRANGWLTTADYAIANSLIVITSQLYKNGSSDSSIGGVKPYSRLGIFSTYRSNTQKICK